MPQKADTLDLSRFVPTPGDGRRVDVDVEPGRLVYGGQPYEVEGGKVPARLDLSRTTTGYALRLRFDAPLEGPCVRCLEPAAEVVSVDAREVAEHDATEEELQSPYVADDELDLRGWAHDALALAMPDKFLCRADCAGLCGVCGEPLNDAEPGAHDHEKTPDPRWDKLRELQSERPTD
jgi:uncharacterized protein